jgi:hypothetical protein
VKACPPPPPPLHATRACLELCPEDSDDGSSPREM